MNRHKALVAAFFVAALLAVAAVTIRYVRSGRVNVPVAAAAFFLAAAGVHQARRPNRPLRPE